MLDPLVSPVLLPLAGVTHGFFTRAGGVSLPPYATLNCGLGSADRRQDVLENRARVARHLGAEPARLLTAYQIHSATAVVVDRPWTPDSQPRADALVTATPGLTLGALAADCTPVLFADATAGVIAAAHAGWKGALAGIIEATVVAMQSLGAHRDAIVAAVGPCISQPAYEVGPEFQAVFTASNPNFSRYFMIPAGATRAHFDLPGFVRDRLASSGVGHIEHVAACTYADSDRFFSYRRMTHRREADYGRQISAIALS